MGPGAQPSCLQLSTWLSSAGLRGLLTIGMWSYRLSTTESNNHNKGRVFALAYLLGWRRQWHPSPVLLAGKSHGRRSLVGCHLWGCTESDSAERLHFHFSLSCTGEGNGNPLRCSCLETPRDGGAWWAAVHGVTQSRTQVKRFSIISSSSLLGPPSGRAVWIPSKIELLWTSRLFPQPPRCLRILDSWVPMWISLPNGTDTHEAEGLCSSLWDPHSFPLVASEAKISTCKIFDEFCLINQPEQWGGVSDLSLVACPAPSCGPTISV